MVTLVFTACFLTGLLTYTYHTSASLGRTEYSEYSMLKGYSYIINNDGTTVAALSGTTGAVAYSSTNASYVIQSAINALPNTGAMGREIYLKSAPSNSRYELTTVVTVDRPVTIRGEGTAGTSYTYIRGMTAGMTMFNVTSSDVCFENLKLVGGASNINGIIVKATATSTISMSHIYFTQFSTALTLDSVIISHFHDLRFHNNAIGLDMKGNSYSNEFIECTWTSNSVVAIRMRGTGIFYNHFLTSDIEVNAVGIQIRYNSAGNIFENIWLEDSTTYDIDLNDTTGYSAASENHFIFGHLGYAGGLKVVFGTGAYYNTIESGKSYADTIASLADNGVGNKITTRDTKNSGIATSITNGTWVSHNLAGTPTIVILTPRSQVTVWCMARNSTMFQVGISSGTATIDWYAEYHP